MDLILSSLRHGPDRNDKIDENCDAQENDTEDDSTHLLPSDNESSSLSESNSYHPVNPQSSGSAGSRPSTRDPQRYRVPSSAMPSFKIPPVDTNISKLRAAIRGLAYCLGAELNSLFDPTFHTKVHTVNCL
jgi:hypothetical protein